MIRNAFQIGFDLNYVDSSLITLFDYSHRFMNLIPERRVAQRRNMAVVRSYGIVSQAQGNPQGEGTDKDPPSRRYGIEFMWEHQGTLVVIYDFLTFTAKGPDYRTDRSLVELDLEKVFDFCEAAMLERGEVLRRLETLEEKLGSTWVNLRAVFRD